QQERDDAHDGRAYWSTWPVTQPGPNCWPGGGGCGAESPLHIAITLRLSSLGSITDWPPAPVVMSPPSRQWSALESAERNFSHPSCSSCPSERSVVSGFTNDPPSNGSSSSVPIEVNFCPTAWITACWRAPRV